MSTATHKVTRVNVYDEETGALAGWFDRNAATSYPDGTSWDGSNHHSLATGSAWSRETLHRTARGRWVIVYTSGETTRARFVGEDAARQWLILNEYSNDEIEAAVGQPVPAEMGRPEIGPKVKVHLADDVVATIDALAKASGVTRSAWIRTAIDNALAAAAASN